LAHLGALAEAHLKYGKRQIFLPVCVDIRRTSFNMLSAVLAELSLARLSRDAVKAENSAQEDLNGAVLKIFQKPGSGDLTAIAPEGIQLLIKVVGNIISSPAEAKFRRLKTAGHSFEAGISPYPARLALLQAIGFEQGTAADKQALIMADARVNVANLTFVYNRLTALMAQLTDQKDDGKDASAGLTDCLTLLQLHISTVAQLGISANALKKGGHTVDWTAIAASVVRILRCTHSKTERETIEDIVLTGWQLFPFSAQAELLLACRNNATLEAVITRAALLKPHALQLASTFSPIDMR